MIAWTHDDQLAAGREGWGIYGRMAGGRVRIEGVDTFSGDHRANAEWVEHVAKRANEGSELHIKALAYVAQRRLRA